MSKQNVSPKEKDEKNVTIDETETQGGVSLDEVKSADHKKNIQGSKYVSITTNILIIVIGLAVGFMIFSIVRAMQISNEKQNLVASGVTSYETGEFSRSLSNFNKALDKGVATDTVHRYLGRLYSTKRDYKTSIQHYEKLDLSEENTVEDLSRLGDAYYFTGEYDKLNQIWGDKTDLLDALSIFILADSYYEVGDIDKYYSTLEKISQTQEARLLLDSKDYSPENINLEEIGQLEPIPQLRSYPKLKDKYNWDAFTELYADSLTQYIQDNEEYARLLGYSAYANLNKCKVIESGLQNLKNILLDNDFPTHEITFLEGFCLNQAGKPKEALEKINIALEADRLNVDFREEKAKSYYMLEDVQHLEDIYKEIETLTDTKYYYNNLAGMLYDLQEYEKAREYLNIAYTSEKFPDEQYKGKISLNIFRVNILKLDNPGICNDAEKFFEVVSLNVPDGYETYEQNIILGHCDIYKGRESRNFETPNLNEYFYYIYYGAKDGALRILDFNDFEGILTDYYLAFGQELVEIERSEE